MPYKHFSYNIVFNTIYNDTYFYLIIKLMLTKTQKYKEMEMKNLIYQLIYYYNM